MKRVLITGAAGFIGSHLTKYLLSLNLHVSGFDQRSTNITANFYKGELMDRAIVARTLLEVKPDVIFHLAGIIKASEPEDLYRANLLGTIALFDSIINCDLCPIVVLASSSGMALSHRTSHRAGGCAGLLGFVNIFTLNPQNFGRIFLLFIAKMRSLGQSFCVDLEKHK